MRIWLCSLLAACGIDRAPAEPIEAPPGEAFLANCASCHGEGGEGTGAAPQIQNPVRGYATYVIRNGRGREMGYVDAMTAFDRAILDDAALTEILDMLASAPKPTTGDGLYTRFCGNCHGASAQGGRVGKDITREHDELAEAVREGHHTGAYGDRTEYMPAWSRTEISDAELALIGGYLATLPAGPDDDDD